MPVTSTRILTDKEPLDVVLNGAEKLYKSVSTTMGPRGQNVVFRKYGKRVGITHDGVTVAKMVKSNDEAEDAIIDIFREAALKLDATTGDGTTTVTVLTYHILKEAAKYIKDGTSPMALRLKLEALLPDILEQIDKHTDKDITEEKLIQIATVASGSRDIGETVGKAIFEAGAETPIMLGFSDSDETYSEVTKGFKIDSGAATPYLMEGAIKLEIPNPYIVVIDAKLRDKDDILPLLKMFVGVPDADRRFLLVCSDIAGDALSYMVANRLKGFADIAVARVPQHIQSHAEYLADVAVACGAQVLSRNTGNTIKEPRLEHLGRADKVTVEPRETVIINGHPIKEDIEKRIADLKDFEKEAKTKQARKFAKDRLYTLEQKVVGIFVGGQSESDAEERHYRFEDAVGASKAALRSGVVPGGGTLLYNIKTGDGILDRAFKVPMNRVLYNAGIELPTPDKVSVGRGFDVIHPEDGIIDLVERGIIDPAESEKECVKTAVSIAGLLMTTGALIVDELIKEDKDEATSEIRFGSSSAA